MDLMHIIFLFVVECPHEELYIIVIFQSSLHHMSNQDQPDRSEESGELHQVGQHLRHAASDHGLRHRGGITQLHCRNLITCTGRVS